MIASKDSSVIAPSDQLNDGIRNWLLGARAFSILLAIFVVLFSWQTWRSEKGKISDNLKTTAEVESRALERYFQRHERAIQGLREDILDPDGQLLPDEKVHTLLRKAVSREQDWLSVVINTAEGKIVNSSRSLPSAIEAQQRGRYNADLSRAVEELRRDNRLNIGRAVRGRVTNEWVVPLRLGIYDGKGTLTHVIAAALPLTRPISFWEGVPFPNSGGVAINLVREDVYLIGRYPLPQGATAEEVYGAPRTGEFAQRLAQGKLLASGVYQGTAALTGESVLWGYGRLQRYPLAFVIQAPSTLLWNRWWGQVWPVYGMLAFILLCAILIYRVAVNREISNHRESEIAARKLKESETRLELAVRGSRDGIWDWNVVTGENYFSPRWLEILGYAAHELPHTAAVFFDRLHPDDKDAVVDAVKRVSGMDFPVHYAPRRQGDPPEQHPRQGADGHRQLRRAAVHAARERLRGHRRERGPAGADHEQPGRVRGRELVRPLFGLLRAELGGADRVVLNDRRAVLEHRHRGHLPDPSEGGRGGDERAGREPGRIKTEPGEQPCRCLEESRDGVDHLVVASRRVLLGAETDGLDRQPASCRKRSETAANRRILFVQGHDAVAVPPLDPEHRTHHRFGRAVRHRVLLFHGRSPVHVMERHLRVEVCGAV